MDMSKKRMQERKPTVLEEQLKILVKGNGSYIPGKKVLDVVQNTIGEEPSQAHLNRANECLKEMGYEPNGRGYKLKL